MCRCDIHTIQQAYQETMQKIAPVGFFCNLEGTDQQDHEPENPFNFGWYKKNSGQCHEQSKKRQLKDKFPVHF